ncbi:unnamed protein product [Parnassius apollo]|uniref:(apollo) hypothetical protein n=1 Tax=Parnassius apollo TaxID=110799 RepID=A0A8S3XG78_PARAO|nr:unnamed protein product [Parnassius apollo]
MNAREHRIMKRKWQQANKKRREKKQMLENVLLDTPALSPIPENPQIRPHSATPTLSEASSARGRKKVKRDRSKMYRDNIKLQEKIEQLEKRIRKYKKRLQRKSKRDGKVEHNSNDENKYKVLSNAIKERYKTVKNRKEKRLIHSILQTPITKKIQNANAVGKRCFGRRSPSKIQVRSTKTD